MTEVANKLLVNPKEYFHTKVSKASDDLKINLDDDVEFYIVNLLCDFIDPSKISSDLGDGDILDTPLAMIFKKSRRNRNA